MYTESQILERSRGGVLRRASEENIFALEPRS
jgi:hypothetical protein